MSAAMSPNAKTVLKAVRTDASLVENLSPYRSRFYVNSKSDAKGCQESSGCKSNRAVPVKAGQLWSDIRDTGKDSGGRPRVITDSRIVTPDG